MYYLAPFHATLRSDISESESESNTANHASIVSFIIRTLGAPNKPKAMIKDADLHLPAALIPVHDAGFPQVREENADPVNIVLAPLFVLANDASL